jgi:dihydrofolate synthase / folylpolyglutamate synthase
MNITNYSKVIDFLFTLERKGLKYTLDNIRFLLQLLGNPQNNFKAIHIAGTNGKGSVCAFLNSIFIESGIKTGQYTSPHILDFRERILINGKFISREYILKFVKKYYKIIQNGDFSFFEIITALAFKYFSDNKIQIAVVETGMGGRLDSTNILTPVLSVLTCISKDHSNYLGNTLRKITYEKAGIFKKGIPCVIGNVNSYIKKQLNNYARNKKTPLYFIKGKLNISDYYLGNNNSIQEFQKYNLEIVLKCLQILENNENVDISTDKIINGILKVKENSKFYGRFSVIKRNPLIIIDVSHNPQAIANTKTNLKQLKYKKLYILFGIMQDKDFTGCIKLLDNLNGELILTRPGNVRALSPELLIRNLVKSDYVIINSVKESYLYILKKMKKNDALLVIGSFYLVSDFLKVSKLTNTIYD